MTATSAAEGAAGTRPVSRGAGGWAGVALAGVAFAVAMLGTTIPTPLYSIYAAEFGFGELMVTVVFSVYAAGVVAGLLAFGHWSDQLGRRPMLAAGLVLSALSAVVYLLPAEFGWLFAGRVLSGLSAGIFTGTATATIADLAPSGAGGRAGLVAAGVNMGGLGLGPLLAGVLSQYAPWPTRLVFVVDLALVAIGLGCVAAMRESVRRARPARLRPRSLRVPPETRRPFVRAGIAGFAGFAVTGLFTGVAGAFLSDVLGYGNRALVGTVVMVFFAASVAGQVLSTRLDIGTGLRAGCVTLLVGMVVLGASLPATSLAVFVVAAVVVGTGQGMAFRAGLTSVTSAAPVEQRGAVTSAFFTALYAGLAAPVIGEGALAGGIGLISAGVAFAALIAVLVAVALVLLARAERNA